MEEIKPISIVPKGKPGRRLGSKNKVTNNIRSKYAKFLEMSFKDILKQYNTLDLEAKIRMHNQIAQLVVPKAVAVRQESFTNGGNDNTPLTITLQLGDTVGATGGIVEDADMIDPEEFNKPIEPRTNHHAYMGAVEAPKEPRHVEQKREFGTSIW